ncbi:unnamed protein product [Urochloa decumbens]|uniref:phosphatidylserine decarboxylase n=1 Tax=Urochloa decumbens TaxID=240449 RepID=A0ABC9H6B9_9POAL
MRFRVRPPSPWPPLPPPLNPLVSARHCLPSRRIHAANSQGKGKFLLPGATAAVLVMLGALHARRMYDDKKVVQRKEKGIEPEFSPDFKASFLRLLPLHSMSRLWGSLMEVDIPVLMRRTIYKAWARAFHFDLQEVALPLEEYPSLQAFFIRSLKEGARPIDPDPNCLVSPVDGKVLRLGKLREEEPSREHIEQSTPENSNAKSWWRVSVASPKLRDQTVLSPKKDIFYCVSYLHPGDYHRVHSPVDCNILKRRRFSGHLFPQNERAVRTIRNLYVENERVVLEGRWKEGFVAIAAVGATNVGSIRVKLEPELRANREVSRMVYSLPPEEHVYEPEGTGVVVKKGEEIAGFKMGSTVVLVFEAPAWKQKAREDATMSSASADFSFCVRAGDKVRVGEAIGRWTDG